MGCLQQLVANNYLPKQAVTAFTGLEREAIFFKQFNLKDNEKIKNLDINFSDARHLSREQMRKIMGGVLPSTTGGTKYKCCPKDQPDSQFCSTCVTVQPGYHALCSQGVVTPC